jgi:hypothetical protein
VPQNRFKSKIKQGRKILLVEFTIEVLLGSKEGVLCFKVRAGGLIVGTAEIEYARGG